MAAELDSRRFRDAMRRFVTGVTVITTRGPQNEPIGLTANSFNSVSLAPPLVLWSLNKLSRNLEVFMRTSHYGISVLAHDQVAIANRFASPVEDRFAGIDWVEGRYAMPLFPHCVAWFECRSEFRYEGGDHIIFVGEVTDFGYSDRLPLLYSGGRYGIPGEHPDSK